MSQTPLASIQVAKTYGVDRSLMSHMLQNQFVIAPNYRDLLSEYQLLYWSVSHTLFQNKAGYISGHIVVYHNCTRGSLMLTPTYKQVALSFRAAIPEYNLPAYVLISLPRTQESKE